MATNTTVMQDMTASDGSMSAPTLDSYLNALRRIFVIDDLMAWSPSMRSKTAVRTTPKRHFVDPSIATAVLRTNPDGLIEDFNTFGFLFESLCTRDFKIYAQANDGDLYHYRDKSNLEADIIMALRNGKWAAIEVKLGSKQIEEAAANLLKLKEKINTEKMGEPSFLMVVTGGEVGYRRADGVWVVPLACLRD
jgi:predicted AAA+ superfamily ATPase